MKSTILKTQRSSQDAVIPEPDHQRRNARIPGWLRCWELYPILLLATFLRFYLLNTTEFDADQAAIFQMARDAITHGQLVATSNVASVGNFNPPGIIYFLMLPALFSANPFWGAAWTAALGVLSVLLTYLFTRRYYGRMAATIATLLYASAALPVFYSRFMWNQNLLLPFLPLFLFALYRGAVERRAGWLPLAVFLLGVLFQLHASALYLVVPLLVVVMIAPRTIRWRDVPLSIGSLLIIYSTYIIWEISTHFSDISTILKATKRHSFLDLQPFADYQLFLSPYNRLITGARSLLTPILGALNVAQVLITLLLLMSVGVAVWLILRPRLKRDQAAEEQRAGRRSPLVLLVAWWRALCASPGRSGLLVLLIWQLVPLLALIKRSIILYPHYLIVLMPGPFILMGILAAGALIWLRDRRGWWRAGRLAFSTLLGALVLAQIVGSTGSVLDLGSGHFVDSELSTPYYNDLASMQNALTTADRFAQQHDLHHIYVDADDATLDGFSYLIGQMHTPTTVFNDTCLVLPSPAAGPALLLVGPYSDFTNSLVMHFAQTRLIAAPSRLGGRPFRLYTVTSLTPAPVAQATLSSDLQWLGSQPFAVGSTTSFVTRWRLLRSMAPADDTYYSYKLLGGSNANKPAYPGSHGTPNAHTPQGIARNATQNATQNRLAGAAPSPSQAVTQILAPKPRKSHVVVPATQCTFTSLQAGDQLFVSFLPPGNAQRALNLHVEFTMFTRDNIQLAMSDSLSLSLETFKSQQGAWQTLKTSDGSQNISIPTS